MQTVGLIAEYNPFHSGHLYHIARTRAHFGEEAGIVCIMSGNWVQRGEAALCDKWTRAGMALRGGVDLVLELPTPWALSSAESFARGAVALLSACGLVDALSFGSESGSLEDLQATAGGLSSTDFTQHLRQFLDQGLSFPHARQQAATALLGHTADCLKTANNNLGVEYLRAITKLGSSMQAFTILRQGVGHDSPQSCEAYASASQLRKLLLSGSDPLCLTPYLSPADAAALHRGGLASLHEATRAVFARLRILSADDLLAFPDCKEGLHNLLHKAAMQTSNLESLYEAVKSRRYTHARIRRLVLAAFLGVRSIDRPSTPPYLRVLGMNKRGQALLRRMKQSATLPILTKAAHIQKLSPEARRLFELEARCTALYDLCRRDFGATPAKAEYSSNPILL